MTDAERLAAIRTRREIGYQLDTWDTDFLLAMIARMQERIDSLERRLYARAQYLGDRRGER